jgi:hypothetical protein
MTAASEGRPAFRIAIGRRVHISGWPAILLAPLAIPIVLLTTVVVRVFGLKNTTDLTARDVEDYLRDFIEGTGGEWDWDDFISIPISDPTLDAIREEAIWVSLPVDDDGMATLRRLLDQVRRM